MIITMNGYVVFTEVQTEMDQAAFVRALQFAYDGGAEGSFQTRPIPGGYQLAFLRPGDDSHPMTLEQLADEIELCNLPLEVSEEAEDMEKSVVPIHDMVAKAIREKGWIPFFGT